MEYKVAFTVTNETENYLVQTFLMDNGMYWGSGAGPVKPLSQMYQTNSIVIVDRYNKLVYSNVAWAKTVNDMPLIPFNDFFTYAQENLIKR